MVFSGWLAAENFEPAGPQIWYRWIEGFKIKKIGVEKRGVVTAVFEIISVKKKKILNFYVFIFFLEKNIRDFF